MPEPPTNPASGQADLVVPLLLGPDRTPEQRQANTSVLVVDDHRMIADSLRLRLISAPGTARAFVPVATAYSLRMARSELTRRVPDLVLLDYQLGDGCGLDLLPDLGALQQPPVTLILAADGDPLHVVEGLAQAAGWVSKGTPVDQLLVAIEAVMAGQTYITPRLVRPVLDQLLLESGRRSGDPSFVDRLSARELEVLCCLVAGMTRQEVALHLFISANTVRTHVQNLLRHAEVHSTLALIARARELGVTGLGQARL